MMKGSQMVTVDPTAYKRRTMQAYDELIPELVDGFDQHFEAFARLEADRLLARLRHGALVLDLGCGGGPASSYLSRHGCTTVSADLSEAMVRACRRRGLDPVVRLDLEELPFARHAFDAIWAHTSLIHVPKERLARALEGVARVLKPGGVLFVALREGKTQGYEGQAGRERWFANYAADEFERYVPAGLRITKRGRTDRKSVAFLNLYLRKGR
jgi:SAM-dependent methyltransferase